MSRGQRLTHLDAEGRAHMVDVGAKPISARECVARGELRMRAETLALVVAGELPKGDVLATARIAGIQAAKRTHEWIPLAHVIPLDAVEVDIEPDPDPGQGGEARLRIEARVRAQARTGVEMEALVAVSAAALVLYDMCKAVDREMRVEGVRLVSKRGGKSGSWQRPGEPA